MKVRWHVPLEELVRLERAEKNASHSKRLQIVDCDVAGSLTTDLSAVGVSF